MTMMATMPTYGKNLKKPLLLGNQRGDDLETWYASLGARVLPSIFKWWRWVDFDLFYGKVKYGPLCFSMGKRSDDGFFRNYCSVWFETSNRWPKWQYVSVDIKTLSPTPGLYTCIKSWKKKYIKSDLKEISLKQMGKVITGLSVDIKLLHPEGCLTLPRGYIHALNHEKVV